MSGTARGNTVGETTEATLEEAQFEAILQQMELNDADAQQIRTLTRLLVGGTLVGWDELIARLKEWDQDKNYRTIDQPSGRSLADGTPPGFQESNVETLRFALIGLLFETQSRMVDRSQSAWDLANRSTGAMLSPVMNWMGRSRLLGPARRRFNRLVDRGEREVDRWIEQGRTEEMRSRKLALTAAQETFGESMDILAHAPELEELVRSQSAGLTQEVVDEVRSRTIDADLIAERVARGILRRPTIRRLLPASARESDQEIPPEGQ